MSSHRKPKFADRTGKILLASAALILSTAIIHYSTLESTEDPSSRSSEFNRNDVMFMNMMIVHHDQAIEMSKLAENRTENEKILELSENISEAQAAENQQMIEWMRELGYEPGNHHPMAGMASKREMQQLRNSNGSEFNQMFAELMIEHHRGGINMAKEFREVGSYSELQEMQKRMIETQEKEIQKMKTWQEEEQL